MSRPNTLATIALTAVLYFVVGQMSLLLAIPPGFAAPVWPAAGIALAAVLLRGWRVGLGIWLGSFGVNVGMSPESWPVAASIGVGAVLQAYFGAWLVRRLVGFPTLLERQREALAFQVVGPIGCLTGATWGVATLLAAGKVPWPNAPVSWGTWWVGDTIGVLVMAPVVLIWFCGTGAQTRRRRLSVTGPLVVTLAAVIFFFALARTWETDRVQKEFARRTAVLAEAIERRVNDYVEILYAVGRFYASSKEVDRDEFRTFVLPYTRFPGIRAMSWNEVVWDRERDAFEAACRQDGYPDFHITESDERGDLVCAGRRAEYAAIRFIEPAQENRMALGYDVYSARNRREALERARDMKETMATARIAPVQEARSNGFAMFQPIYANDQATETLAERRLHLRGYVAVVVILRELVDATFKNLEHQDLTLQIEDVDAAEADRLLLFGRWDAVQTDPEPKERPVIEQARDIEMVIGGRCWRLRFTPTPSYLSSQQTWSAWAVLVGGLLFAGLLETFLLVVTGNTSQVEFQVAEQTAALRESEERFRNLFETANDLVSVSTMDGRLLSLNPVFETITGWPVQDWIGKTYDPLLHPDDRALVAAYVTDIAQGKTLPPLENHLLTRDGTYTEMETTIKPLMKDGQVVALFGISRHVAERKRSERELYEAKDAAEASERRVRLIVDTAHDAFVSIDAAGRISDWNSQAEATFGWSRHEAQGRSLSDTIIPLRFREAHEQGLRRFLTSGEGSVLNKRIELPALHRTGREFPVELTIFPIRLTQTHIFCAFLHDITERKRTETELNEAKEAAEAASRAKSEFLANMSHEIRTPMNGILGMADLALHTDLTVQQREFVRIIKASGDSLLTIINDLLDYSRIEADRLELDPFDFRLRDSLGDLLKPLAMRAHEKCLELTYEVAHEVPDGLHGDWNRLRQVLINLIGNAIKFTHQGDVTIAVEVATAEPSVNQHPDDPQSASCHLRFAVKDTGIGIPADRLDAIFAPFEQVDRGTARQYGGTGLGLAICARLVELMGGRIEVQSDVGRGSTFRFTIPLHVRNGTFAPRLVSPPNLRELLVLVVDDNATSLRIEQQLLLGWGMRPSLAESGAAALAELTRAAEAGTPYSLMLLDLNMPGMDGLETARQVRADPRLAGIPILMLSSAQSLEAARRAEAGVTGFLTKPVKPSELLETIQELMTRREDSSSPRFEPNADDASSGLPPLTVLLVEDNAINRRVATALLERQGHRVLVAENGLDAVESMKKDRFDVVLMDVQMPEMDGLEATRRVRAWEKEAGGRIPIIAVTAHAMKGDRERFLVSGMDGYVAKPIEPRELWQAIRQTVLANRGGLPETSSTKSTSAEVFDRKGSLRRVGGDPVLLAEVIRLFCESAKGYLSAIDAAVGTGDARTLFQAAHALKGSVSFYGAAQVAAVAQRLEQMGRGENLAGADEALVRLRVEMDRLLEALTRENTP